MLTKNKTHSLKIQSPYIDAFRITKGTKFSKAKRNLSQCYNRSSSPSPNQYKYEDYQKNKISPKFSFGKEKKFFLNKKQLKCKTQIPGPNKYKPNQTRTSIKITIPQGQRLGLQNHQDVPAVGSYEIQKQSSKHSSGVKFPKQKRHTLANISIGPGPNKYFIDQDKQTACHQTFNKSKKLLLKLDAIPGVGQYSIFNFKQKHSPCARITSIQRTQRRYQTVDQPGPGNYTSCSVEKYKPQSKLTTVIFNKAKRQKTDNLLIPGPGDYNISQHRKKTTGAFLTSRYICQNHEQNPGPAKYQPKLDFIVQTSRSAKIGKAPRLLQTQKLSPSPHDYHPQIAAKIKFSSTGFTFPKKIRQLD